MRPALIALALLLCGATAFAQSPDLIDADRPGVADGSSVVGKWAFQIETGFQTQSRSDERSAFIPTLVRVGLSDRLEARVEGNTFKTVSVRGMYESGLAPTSVGFKAAVLSADAAGLGIGVIGRVFPAWGTGNFKADHVAGDIRLAIDWDFAEHFTLNPNAGLSWVDGEESTFPIAALALTLAYARRPSLTWFIDTSFQQHEVAGGRSSMVVDGGAAYIPREDWQLDISIGTRALGNTEPSLFVAAGVAFRTRP